MKTFTQWLEVQDAEDPAIVANLKNAVSGAISTGKDPSEIVKKSLADAVKKSKNIKDVVNLANAAGNKKNSGPDVLKGMEKSMKTGMKK